MDILEAIDQWIVLSINGANSPFFDVFFWLISGKIIWIPMYLFILFWVYRFYSLKFFVLFTTLAILSVVFADLTSAQLIKEVVARYRPSHHMNLSNQLHYHVFENGEKYFGGQYGFVSNHATNFAAVSFWTCIAFWSKQRWLCWLFIGITLFVAYSRIYLGVHYFTDIVGGFCLGIGISALIFNVFSKQLKVYQ
jgi:undecaprenyl-diphosphatase